MNLNLNTLWPIAAAAAIFLLALFLGLKGRQIRKALRRRDAGRRKDRALASRTQATADLSGEVSTPESHIYDSGDFRCTKCNSPNLRRVKRRWYHRPPFHRKARRFQCRDCKNVFLLEA